MHKLKNILLVDDDEVTNYINYEIIKDLNITEEIHVCENGKEAIDYLRQAYEGNSVEHVIPDLIFLDLNMPVMDGFEFMENFHKIFGGKMNCRIVTMLTTSLRREDMNKALSAEEIVTGYIEKPLTKDHVMNILQGFFDEK